MDTRPNVSCPEGEEFDRAMGGIELSAEIVTTNEISASSQTLRTFQISVLLFKYKPQIRIEGMPELPIILSF